MIREREKTGRASDLPRLPFSTNLDMAVVASPNGHYMNGNANTEYEMADATQVGAVRFTSGLILPPPEIKCEFIYPLYVQPLIQPLDLKP